MAFGMQKRKKMDFVKNFINKNYYKIRIVLTFSLVTILLAVILSRVSYHFVKEIYLAQLSEQVLISVKTAAAQIDQEYIDILELGKPARTTEEYYKDIFSGHLSISRNAELFIFDRDFNLSVHSNPDKLTDETETSLLLNRHEISNLRAGDAVSSLPFKGDDGRWYLWGFCRLNGNYWLALKESAARLSYVESFSRIFWYTGTAGVIVTLFLSLLISGSITKPLKRLTIFSREIGRGNMFAQEPREIKGEIHALSSAMAMMRNDLVKNQKEKEDMLAQIAHEIRNPLGGIELLASLSREDLIKDNKNTEYHDRILSEVNGLKSLITAYLSYSRPVQAMPETIRLSSLSESVTELMAAEIKAKQVCLAYQLSTGKIIFDPGHLKQILINLLSNSLDAICRGGKIVIRSSEENGQVRISVVDDGPGIEKDIRNKVFEPFFTTKKDGTGLGLAVCRKLCTENRAELYLEETERGSCFTIIKEIEK